MALTRADVGVRFVDGLEKKGINTKKIREDILKEKMKSKEFRIGTEKGKSKASDDDEKKYRVYKKGGVSTETKKKQFYLVHRCRIIRYDCPGQNYHGQT